MFAIAEGDATVIVGLLSLLGVLITVIGVQLKVHRDNQTEHGQTAEKVDRLLDNQSTIQRDVQYIRADVTDIHGAIRELRQVDDESHARITKLERKQPGGDAA